MISRAQIHLSKESLKANSYKAICVEQEPFFRKPSWSKV